ncbi:DUF4198 domain-containing protein [Pusillimonas sp. ANT_WB101]|uniref:DUF4198 domain-containing protein n=1 Tax=Pusillimonas sp. ANT_WB101 TaxID=2597356 RepID=UPI0011EFF677|nr:DUF4198 domain-containing protein [Pusillimonas sp. ANT_WB101]KAA0911859.1 DUF4198 domain-containing protein [Pusillimonas sp. ANT_WB101]
MKHLAAILLSLSISGCTVQTKNSIVNVMGEFDERLAKNQIQEGTGTLNGSAFLLQRGGGVVTCAGRDVELIPVTDYAADRLRWIYGRAPAAGEVVRTDFMGMDRVNAQFTPDIPGYHTHKRVTKCDAQGEFSFQGLKDGQYFVIASVIWFVPSPQGGLLATKVKVSNGKAAKVIMSS